MNFQIITDYRLIDSRKWIDFVNKHPMGNIFQTPIFANIYHQTDNHELLAIFCLNSSSEILGFLQAIIIKQFNGFLSKFTIRSIITGGPLIINNDLSVLQLLLKHYEIEIRSKNVIYTQFRNLFDTSEWRKSFERYAYYYEEHLDIHVDLKKPVSQLWAEMHPTRRKQISRGLRRGITIKIINQLNRSEIENCYKLLTQVYKKARIPLASIRLFLNANDILKESNLLYILANFEDKIIGFRVALLYKNVIYDWYAASNFIHYDKYPNDILPWEIIKWGIANNYEIFDFGGAGKPNISYGVRDYKSKFGGYFHSFGRYEKTHKLLLFHIIKILYRIRQYF